MTLLGIELSDAGILAAAGNPPRLLPVDGGEHESPGCALSTDGRIEIGNNALGKVRLNPRAATSRFWDDLSTEPIKQPGLEGKTNAELAYLHLSHLWNTLKTTADAVVITVPGSYTDPQLGILLGIANALSMPVKGFVPTALASFPAPRSEQILVHLDIHLHRIEITILEDGDKLQHRDVQTIAGKGLSYLYTEWVKMIADEFVRTTRFDPFDQAVYEQELYSRLPRVLEDLRSRSSTTVTIQARTRSYQIPLTGDLFVHRSEAVFQEVRRIIEEMVSTSGPHEQPCLLQLTHRVGALPGWKEALGTMPALTIMELAPGSGALGALRLRDRFAGTPASSPVMFITSIPRQRAQETGVPPGAIPGRGTVLPTHILHRNHAYPLTTSPLVIGGKGTGEVSLHTPGGDSDPSHIFCTIAVEGTNVMLVNHAADGTLVDGERVFATHTLRLGQTIRVGPSPDEFRLIVCVEAHEKEKHNRI